LLKKVRRVVRKIGQASAAKGARAEQLKPSYKKLLKQAAPIVGHVVRG